MKFTEQESLAILEAERAGKPHPFPEREKQRLRALSQSQGELFRAGIRPPGESTGKSPTRARKPSQEPPAPKASGYTALPDLVPRLIEYTDIAADMPEATRRDLVYMHPVFLQCFLPVREKLEKYRTSWENKVLNITAGEIADPSRRGVLKQCLVPYGAKARLLFSYINHAAFDDPEHPGLVDMGNTLHEFLTSRGISWCGSNARELQAQLENIASAQIQLVVWGASKVTDTAARVAHHVEFWKEKTPEQQTFWQPKMQLSKPYLDMLNLSRVPVFFPGLVNLDHSPRAMDLFSFYSSVLPNLRAPMQIPYEDLAPVFGGAKMELRNFRRKFIELRALVQEQYPTAKVTDLLGQNGKELGIVLHRSPPLIPSKAPDGAGVLDGLRTQQAAKREEANRRSYRKRRKGDAPHSSI